MSFIGYKVTCFLWNNLWLKQIIAFIWLTFMFFVQKSHSWAVFHAKKWIVGSNCYPH